MFLKAYQTSPPLRYSPHTLLQSHTTPFHPNLSPPFTNAPPPSSLTTFHAMPSQKHTQCTNSPLLFHEYTFSRLYTFTAINQMKLPTIPHCSENNPRQPSFLSKPYTHLSPPKQSLTPHTPKDHPRGSISARPTPSTLHLLTGRFTHLTPQNKASPNTERPSTWLNKRPTPSTLHLLTGRFTPSYKPCSFKISPLPHILSHHSINLPRLHSDTPHPLTPFHTMPKAQHDKNTHNT